MQTGRACGECTLCCTVPAIQAEPVRKPAGVSCEHLCQAGCSIYEQRPSICQEFRCHWLEGYYDEHDRPDKLGAMFAWGTSHLNGEPIVIACESEEGLVLSNPRLNAIRESLMERGYVVVIRNTENITWINPNGTRSVARIDPACELKMTPLQEET